MSVLALDLGGTKLATAVFGESGEILSRETIPLNGSQGAAAGKLIAEQVRKYTSPSGEHLIEAIGICIPGIYRSKTGTVWAPNIGGWDDYPLLAELQEAAGNIPVVIDSDRACYILGEQWQGKVQGCTDAVYLAVGTGIGAGILINGNILRGSNDIAGAIGWMALKPPFESKYIPCGCFEYYASGEGIARFAAEVIAREPHILSELHRILPGQLRANDVFRLHEKNDPVAIKVISGCIELWGMAVANLISLFNPQKIILGGGVFGPAIKFLPEIREEVMKWAQPISATRVTIEGSALGADAGLYGAGFLAKKHSKLSKDV